MAETSIEERLDDLARWAGPTFRPAALPEVGRLAKRRRVRRRASVTAAIVVLLALPAVIAVTSGRDNSQPVIGPTATPVTPAPPVQIVSVTLPGERIQKHPPSLTFVDKDHIWLLDGYCDGERCLTRFLASADGGHTWRQTGFPQIPAGKHDIVTFVDAETVVVYASGQGIWLTTDGGQTYSRHALTEAPVQARLASDGAYAMQCPNLTGYGYARDGGDPKCNRKQLVKTGFGPTQHQPPWRGNAARIELTGNDGRIWLNDGTRLAYSADEGRTWHQAPVPPGHLKLSASGEHVGSFYDNEHYRLIGDEWVVEQRPPGLTTERAGVLLDDGSWLVPVLGGVGYLTGGVYRPIPEVRPGARPEKQLADGTLVLSYHDASSNQAGFYMGTGQGRARQWTLVTY